MTGPEETPELFRRAKEVFLAACERNGEERAEYLDRACSGDEKLRAEVEALLRFHDRDPEPSTTDGGRFPAGYLLADRYRLVAPLGRGGMGEVYRAEDLALGQMVALKFLPPELATDETAFARLANEVRMAREVTHANVCRVHDLGTAEEGPYISMEFVDGENLSSLLVRIGRLPEDKCTELARQLCAGLAAAHARGVLHRDLKPANVMIDGRGRVRITDFGIAAPAEGVGSVSRAGTPAYMAPELSAGGKATIGTDLYALGLVLYEMYTGQAAFTGRSAAELAKRHREETPTSPTTVVTALDPAVEQVILQLIEKDPALRPRSALEVAAALPGGDLLAGSLEAGEIPSPHLVAAAWSGRTLSPGMALGVGAAFLVGLITAVFVLGLGFPADRVGLDDPPRVLASTAAQLIRAAGYEEPAADRAFGFVSVPPQKVTIDEDGGHTHYLDLGVAKTRRFWFRRHVRPLAPRAVLDAFPRVGRVGRDDPPLDEDGMISVEFDHAGRLVSFQAMGAGEGREEAATWSPLLAAAGLLGVVYEKTDHLAPDGTVEYSSFEWEGPRQGGERVHLDGVSVAARPVEFDVVEIAGPEDIEGAEEIGGIDEWWLSGTLHRVLLLALLLAAGGLAWHHARRGNSDRRGASRIASFVFIAGLLRWVLETHHVADVGAEVGLVYLALGATLCQAAAVYILYLALEPFVRRYWPRAIVSWTRLLGGRRRDPLVGRDVLVGALAGVLWVLLTALLAAAASWVGVQEGRPFLGMLADGSLAGLRHWIAVLLADLLVAVYAALGFLLVLSLLRALFRRVWVAASVVAAGAVGLFLLLGNSVPGSWLPLGVAAAFLATAILIRLGLVALVTALFTGLLLLSYPVTPTLSEWYADAGLFAVSAAILVALFGYRGARRAGA